MCDTALQAKIAALEFVVKNIINICIPAEKLKEIHKQLEDMRASCPSNTNTLLVDKFINDILNHS